VFQVASRHITVNIRTSINFPSCVFKIEKPRGKSQYVKANLDESFKKFADEIRQFAATNPW
jgi:hypothetical protein